MGVASPDTTSWNARPQPGRFGWKRPARTLLSLSVWLQYGQLTDMSVSPPFSQEEGRSEEAAALIGEAPGGIYPRPCSPARSWLDGLSAFATLCQGKSISRLPGADHGGTTREVRPLPGDRLARQRGA